MIPDLAEFPKIIAQRRQNVILNLLGLVGQIIFCFSRIFFFFRMHAGAHGDRTVALTPGESFRKIQSKAKREKRK